MVTCVNGMVVCRICWFAVLAKKSVIWLSMPRISFGPALLKLLKRSPPPPVVVVNDTVGAAGPGVVPDGGGVGVKRGAGGGLRALAPVAGTLVAGGPDRVGGWGEGGGRRVSLCLVRA